jgi:glycerol-3-phosphate cytidylyltransferase
MNNKMIIGYTTGVFDLFHYGHVNLLKNSKSLCDKLIVGVSTDELAKYKNKTPVICFEDRVEVVRACRYADAVVPQENMDKLKAWKKFKFDYMFVGDDWFETEKWDEIEKQLGEVGVKVIYFPYTKNVSSTMINSLLEERKNKIKDI